MAVTIKLPKKGLKIAHVNICSLRNKVQDITNLLLSDNIHILAISETHLDDSFDDVSVSIQGYNIYRRDRNTYGGGVAIYIQSHIPVKRREDLMSSAVEALWLQVHLPHLKPLLLGCCYRPPSSDSQHLDNLCEMIDKVCDVNREIYLLGDLNINFLSSGCPLKKKLLTVTNACNLVQVINQPTRVITNSTGVTSSTCIDHIYTNAGELCSKAVSVPIGFSDHNLVAISRKAKVPKAGPKIVFKRSYKSFCCDSYVNDVTNICWSDVCKESEPDVALDVFMKLLIPVIDKHAPVRKLTVRTVSALWIDEELKKCMSERDKAKVAAIKSGSSSEWQTYCKIRNNVTKLNRKKKKMYYETKINDIKHDGKKLWGTLNNIMGRKSNSTTSFIESEGAFITKPLDIANYFNDYFMGKVSTLRQGMPTSSCESSYLCIKKQIMKDKNCTFELRKVSIDEVEKLLLSINIEKPPGIDNLDGKLLKIIANHIAAPICHIFNLSFECNVCPQIWKEAKVIPLPKDARNTFTGSNSRPISLSPVLNKLLEKIVFDQIQRYFSVNNLTSDYQHAYRESHSTATALTQMTDEWLKEIDKKNIVGAVLLDFSAAFDLVDHKLLLNKLMYYGFAPTVLSWMESYLFNRTQRVFFNGSFSDATDVESGIPQGSSLGPLLFSIFTNDFPLALKKAYVSMYSDDITIYMNATTVNEITATLNKELQTVLEWVTSNKLALNITKTKSIVFGTNHSLSSKPQLNLRLNSAVVEQVEETKLLGVILDSKLSWTRHIDSVVVKMGRNISIIKRCSAFVTPQLIKQVIQTLVLSHLDYCPMIWSNATKKDLGKLQLAQNRAARLALRCTLRSSVNNMHVRLSWMKVTDRLTASLLVFVRNINTLKYPNCLYKLLTPSSNIHAHHTRHVTRGRYTIPKARTQSMQRTVLYRAMVAWNSLPEQIAKAQTKASFKRQLKQHLTALRL